MPEELCDPGITHPQAVAQRIVRLRSTRHPTFAPLDLRRGTSHTPSPDPEFSVPVASRFLRPGVRLAGGAAEGCPADVPANTLIGMAKKPVSVSGTWVVSAGERLC